MEMFHQQVRQLMRGEDPEEIKEKWENNTWAMLFREGSHTPWLGYSNNLLRTLTVVPAANNFIGDQTYSANLMNAAGLSALEKGARGIQGAFQGDILTRGRNESSKNPQLIDHIMTGGDLVDADGNDSQASKLVEFFYETVFPTRAFWWQGTEAAFQADFSPREEDRMNTIFDAWTPYIDSLIQQGKEGDAEVFFNKLRDTYMSPAMKRRLNMDQARVDYNEFAKPAARMTDPPVMSNYNRRSRPPLSPKDYTTIHEDMKNKAMAAPPSLSTQGTHIPLPSSLNP